MSKIQDLKIKIFADGADLNNIEALNSQLNIKGFTTNPTLMRKSGITDYKNFAMEALKIVKTKPISFEVFSDEFDEMKHQAEEISSWGKNVYVKIPITNSKGIFMGKIIKELNNQNIKLNITAVYSAKQTAKVLKLINKKTKIIISIFAGRAADTGNDPIPEFIMSLNLANKFTNVEILWASVREPYNYLQAKQLGCHIITIPPTTIQKIEKFGKSLNRLTKETVRTFLKDAKKARFKINK